MASEPIGTPIDALPPELLQNVWRHLSFLDLIRSQQVCMEWRRYLPANDPALRRALFLETGSPEEDKVDKIEVKFDLQQHLTLRKGHLPHLTFILIAWKDDSIHSSNPVYHPIVDELHAYTNLVHPYFRFKDTPSHYFFFEFTTLKGLRRLAEPVKSKSASWEQMQMSSLPFKYCEVSMPWYTDFREHAEEEDYESHHSDYVIRLENPTGVTVGQFVEAVRQTLASSESLIKGFSDSMTEIMNYYQAYDAIAGN